MSKTALDIGTGLQLPLDAVTQTFGLLGKRGVGKTHGAVVLAEELLAHGMPVVILDPIGVWWGLRSSADGKSAGHAILVLGGEHGDLPLEPSAGKLIAEFVVSKRASVVLDLGEFSKTQQATFVTDFLERLYQKNREPLQVILDEADAFAPQRIQRGGERCFGAVDTLVRRGRARGLGVTLVTQRSAAINKDVLTQIEVLIAFRTIAPQDRAALEAWIEVHADRAEAAKVLQSLATLEVGEAWVWSPAWLQSLARVRIRRRTTFDSSATPKMGQVVRSPKAAAAIDVAALRGELTALVVKAEAEDPKRLRARIAELERKLADAEKIAVEAAVAATKGGVDRPAVQRVDAAWKLVTEAETALEAISTKLDRAVDLLNDIVLADRGARGLAQARSVPAPARAAHAPSRALPARRVAPTSPASPGRHGEALGKPERAVLMVLAQQPSGCDSGRLTLLAGYRWSGGFRNALSALRTAGLIEGSNGGLMTITTAGLGALGEYDPLPEGAELRAYWLAHPSLGAAERAVLGALIEAHPRGLDADGLIAATGYSWSGGFRNALSKLRTAGLLVGRNGEAMRASTHLFGDP